MEQVVIKRIETSNAPPSFSKYAQATEVPAGMRTIHVSGQVGITVDGVLPETFEDQHRQAWRNVFEILKSADMEISDIASVWAIVTDHDQVPIYREIRDEMLAGHVCASTMLVCGLASPAWKVEIAVVAARAD